MPSLLVAAPLLVSLAAGPVPSADPLEEVERAQQALFDKVSPSVVFISTGDGFGSGFFVSADGLALTNAHVVRDSDQVDVVLQDGTKTRGRVVERAAEDIDLALVQVEAKAATPLPLGGIEEMRVGSWVGQVGHGLGGIWTFAVGMVTNIYPSGSERPVFQTQIPVNPGCSGGPIVDRKGRVVGVTTAAIQAAQNVNFGIRIDVAFRRLEKLADHCACLVIKAPKDVPVLVDGRMAGKGPRVVLTAQQKTYEVSIVHAGKLRKEKVAWPQQRTIDLTR